MKTQANSLWGSNLFFKQSLGIAYLQQIGSEKI